MQKLSDQIEYTYIKSEHYLHFIWSCNAYNVVFLWIIIIYKSAYLLIKSYLRLSLIQRFSQNLQSFVKCRNTINNKPTSSYRELQLNSSCLIKICHLENICQVSERDSGPLGSRNAASGVVNNGDKQQPTFGSYTEQHSHCNYRYSYSVSPTNLSIIIQTM